MPRCKLVIRALAATAKACSLPLGAAILAGSLWAQAAPTAVPDAAVPAGAAAASPRPLSPAERQAAQLAAEYLAGGPAAWWPQLARGSWLRGLGREAAIAEIEVRAGLPAGSHWTLEATPADFAAQGAAFSVEFPSGTDDTLLLHLVPEDGGLKIESLRTAAEVFGSRSANGESGAAGGAATDAGGSAASGSAAGAASGARAWAAAHRGFLAAGCSLTGLTALTAGLMLARRRRAAPARRPAQASFVMVAPAGRVPWGGVLTVGGVALLAAGGAALAFLGAGGGSAGSAAAPANAAAAAGADVAALADAPAPEHVQLRALLPLRRAATQVAGLPDAVGAGPAGNPATAQVALLWRAQHHTEQGDLAGAEALLRGIPAGPTPALASLLRARLGLQRLQELETAVQYERALAAGLAHEGVLIEAAEALYILGFEDTSKRYLHQLVALGARGSEPYYDLADLALLENRDAEAHQVFATGWRLQPIARADLLSQSLSAYMLQDRDLRRMTSLGTFAEPGVSCGLPAARPLALPAGVSAHLLGELLRLTGGGGEVRVPGGCDLAPAGTVQESAEAWQEERDAALLARLPELRRNGATAGAWAQPVLRHEAEEAAAALVKRQRWADLIDITAGLAQPGAVLPPRLTRLRAVALSRLERRSEARQLLVRLALGDKVSRRADPAALYQLAALLEEAGELDQAIRLVTKANSELPSPPGGDRILQLQTEKRLAAASQSTRSPHFTISYPTERGPVFGQEAARILEAEYTRLLKWIPLGGGGAPTDVRLLPFEDFERAYSEGGEVLGLFDGVVRLPLGTLRTFSPFAVSIMTHELAHAMIAQRTADRAPHWFQEGLAQHLEMQEEGRANPIADYRATERLLAFPLLEPALQSYASAVWTAASYDEALWTVNYIESRYGVAGLHRLMDAFRAGQDTNEALASALGSPVARFDQDLWEWCTTKAPRAWQVPVVRYDGGALDPKRF